MYCICICLQIKPALYCYYNSGCASMIVERRIFSESKGRNLPFDHFFFHPFFLRSSQASLNFLECLYSLMANFREILRFTVLFFNVSTFKTDLFSHSLPHILTRYLPIGSMVSHLHVFGQFFSKNFKTTKRFGDTHYSDTATDAAYFMTTLSGYYSLLKGKF